jgi:hypothetical protein
MLSFFIELYESIIDTFNHLISDEEESMTEEETQSTDYIITINDTPIATYDQLFMETQPYSLKQLVAEVRPPTVSTLPTLHSQPSNNHQNLEEIRLEESMMLAHRIIDDYYVVKDDNTQNSIDHDDGWEFINRSQ